MLAEQRGGDRGLVRVAPVERALAHAGRPRDVLHRRAMRVRGEEPGGGGEHAGAVAGGVRALARRLGMTGGRELHHAHPSEVDGPSASVLRCAPHNRTHRPITSVNALLAPLALSIGGLLAVQAAANLQLSTALGSPVRRLHRRSSRSAPLLLSRSPPPSGRSARSARCPTRRAVAPRRRAGVARSTSRPASCCSRASGRSCAVGLFITGQMLASLAVDGFGLLGVAREPLPRRARARRRGRRSPAPRRSCGAAAPTRRSRTPRMAGVRGSRPAPRSRSRGRQRPAARRPRRAGHRRRVLVPRRDRRDDRSCWPSGSCAPPARRGRGSRRCAAMPWWGWLGGLVGATYVTVGPAADPGDRRGRRRSASPSPGSSSRRWRSTATACCASRGAR